MEDLKRTSWWDTTSVYAEVVHCREVSLGELVGIEREFLSIL